MLARPPSLAMQAQMPQERLLAAAAWAASTFGPAATNTSRQFSGARLPQPRSQSQQFFTPASADGSRQDSDAEPPQPCSQSHQYVHDPELNRSRHAAAAQNADCTSAEDGDAAARGRGYMKVRQDQHHTEPLMDTSASASARMYPTQHPSYTYESSSRLSPHRHLNQSRTTPAIVQQGLQPRHTNETSPRRDSNATQPSHPQSSRSAQTPAPAGNDTRDRTVCSPVGLEDDQESQDRQQPHYSSNGHHTAAQQRLSLRLQHRWRQAAMGLVQESLSHDGNGSHVLDPTRAQWALADLAGDPDRQHGTHSQLQATLTGVQSSGRFGRPAMPSSSRAAQRQHTQVRSLETADGDACIME